MSKILSFFGILVLMNCGSTQMVETKNVPDQANPSGPEGVKGSVVEEAPKETNAVGTALSFTDAERVGDIMNYLASDDLKGRDSGSEGIEMAAKYIENYFKSYRVAPYFDTYRDTLSNYKKASYNIVGVVEGNDPVLKDEYILVGAHYDHIGIIKIENGDAIANGANDNASGTTAVMELARYFGKNRTNKRSLIFVLFSAEEKGLLGSKHLAKKLKEQELNLYTMLNFEMIGVPLLGKDYLVYATGYKKSNFADVNNKYAGENLVGYLQRAREYGLFQRSDNYPFYQEFGVPCHTYCTFDFTNFEYYHKVGDEVEEMDFDHMATLINKMLPVVEKIANAPTKEIKMN
ncbi:M20/M25/M40 family metallo-hydrolase [Flagellimonas sp. HMM57]|uniref:M28 family metallopeptidase n=1 Tax=unclassified Flagellimonas TaxID=2644544 RepID=UPI0013D3C891|nr:MULTISPECIES: M20/M25/M40 family metallo-hydrolase [unclassified Flagellimonas]UII74884.1 M20/M25/M40 family metallo-hydrolase [Flagellimonas sp. HMM57]